MIETPKIFYQVWEPVTHTASKTIPSIVMNKNNLHLPDNIKYKLFSLEDMISYLRNNWGNKYVNLFNCYEKIAHKTDLWRYCILYDTGGIYMDADCVLLNNINFLISDYNMVFVTNDRGTKDIFNGFLLSPPKNPIFKEIIDFMMEIGNDFNNDYYFNCKKLYNIVNRYLNIDLDKNEYFQNIKNIDYKILLLKDKRINKININNDKWIEVNRYCAHFNEKQIFIETNNFYPYKK